MKTYVYKAAVYGAISLFLASTVQAEDSSGCAFVVIEAPKLEEACEYDNVSVKGKPVYAKNLDMERTIAGVVIRRDDKKIGPFDLLKGGRNLIGCDQDPFEFRCVAGTRQ